MIHAPPQVTPSIFLFLRLGRARVLEYFRVRYDLVQKGGIREYRIIHFCEFSLVSQLFDESLVFARERENVFAPAIITS